MGIYTVEEELTLTSGSASASGSASDNALGFHILAGVDISLSESASLFLEANFSSAKIDTGSLGQEVDLGGFTLWGGVSF